MKDIFADLDNIAPEPKPNRPGPSSTPGTSWSNPPSLQQNQAPTTPFATPAPASTERDLSGPWQPSLPETPENKSKKWLWWAIVGVVLLGLGGGGYFAYSKGYVAIPFLTPKADTLFDKMIESISDIKNAQYSARVDLKSAPRSSDAKPIFLKNTNANASTSWRGVDSPFAQSTSVQMTAATPYSIEDIGQPIGLQETDLGDSYLGALLGLAQFDEIFGTIPGDINFNGGITVYVEADKEIKDADGSVRIDGTYKGGDISVDLDLEARKVGKDVYGIIRKFPSFFFFDTSAIKEKWVKLSDEEGANYIEDEVYTQFDSKRVVNTLKSSVRNALKEKVFSVERKLPAEVVAGVNSEHYLITIDPEKLVNLYETLIKEAQAKGEDTKKFESIRDALKKQETMDVLKRIADNSRIEIWIDKVKGFLRQTKWELNIVPPEGNERLQGKMFVLAITLTMEKVNQAVKIDVPSPTINLDEASRLLTGITKEQQQAQKQLDRVGAVRSMLRDYKDSQGSYPQSLDELTTEVEVLKATCKENDPTGSSQEKARDAKRKSDLRQLSLALRSSANSDPSNLYPEKLSDASSFFGSNSMPKDPTTGKDYGYASCNGRKSYVLTATLEAYDTDKIYSLNELGTARTGTALTCGETTGSSKSSDEYRCSTIKYSGKAYNATDLYTSKPFGYERTSDDYRLTYEVRLADFQDSYRKDSYVDGTNTATSRDESLEKETPYEKYERERAVNANTNANTNTSPTTDTDGDKLFDQQESTYKTDPRKKDTDDDTLNDYDEVFKYLTSPTKKDTDGDGYDDGTEINSAYNPNGSGQASEEQLRQWGKTTAKPKVSNAAVNLGPRSATFTWETDLATRGTVNYFILGTPSETATEPNHRTSHSLTVVTEPGRTYHYNITDCVLNGGCTNQPTKTFTAQ